MPNKEPFRTIQRPAAIGRVTMEEVRRAVIAMMLESGEISEEEANARFRRVERIEKRLEKARHRRIETAG